MSFSTHTLTRFLNIFVFQKVLGAVTIFEFSIPPLFLSEYALGGRCDPGLMEFTRGHFGGNIDIKEKEEVFFKTVPEVLNVGVVSVL